MSKEPLPRCPHCGKTEEVEIIRYVDPHNWDQDFWRIGCCSWMDGFLTKEIAIKEYNKRALPEGFALVPIEPTEEKLKELVKLMQAVRLSQEYTWQLYALDTYKAVIAAPKEGE